MNRIMVQIKLTALGFYKGLIGAPDGIELTNAMLAYLKAEKINTSGHESKPEWLQIAVEQLIYNEAGIDTAIDGKASPELDAARSEYTRTVALARSVPTVHIDIPSDTFTETRPVSVAKAKKAK